MSSFGFVKPTPMHIGYVEGPRDIVGLTTFLYSEVKMPIATLVQGCLTLSRDLSYWMIERLLMNKPNAINSYCQQEPQPTCSIGMTHTHTHTHTLSLSLSLIYFLFAFHTWIRVWC